MAFMIFIFEISSDLIQVSEKLLYQFTVTFKINHIYLLSIFYFLLFIFFETLKIKS